MQLDKKICKRCNETRTLDLFRKHKNGKYENVCKICARKAALASFYSRNISARVRKQKREEIDKKNLKYCTKCKVYKEKTLEHFYKYKNGSLGSWCKTCVSANNKLARKKVVKDYKKQTSEYRKCSICNEIKIMNSHNFYSRVVNNEIMYYSPCKQCKSKRDKLRQNKKIKKIKMQKCRFCNSIDGIIKQGAHKECANAANRKKYNSDIKVINKRNARKLYLEQCKIRAKIRKTISNKILEILKKNNSSKNGKSIIQFLPYTLDQLKEHLESQFESWMNWNNWGRYNQKKWNDNDTSTWTWQIDHIIPNSLFKYTEMDSEEFSKCWDLSNLRPLSAKQNVLDGLKKVRHKGG